MVRLSAFALFLSALCAQSAEAGFLERAWEDRFEEKKILSLTPQVTFYTTAANFDADGTKIAIPNLGHYRRSAANLLLAYGFAERWSLYLLSNWTGVDAQSTALTGHASGLGDQSVGLSYRFLAIPLKRDAATPLLVHLQIQSDFPGYKNSVAAGANAPFIGDGSADATFGAFVHWPISGNAASRRQFTLRSGAGYAWRSNGFAPQLPWSAKIEFETAARFALEMGFAGMRSLRSGPDAVSTIGSPGSFRVNADHPSEVRAMGAIRFALGRTGSIRLAVQQSLAGSNAPSGFLAALGATWFWDLGIRKNPLNQTPSAYGKSNQGFIHYALDGRVIRTNDRLHLVKIDKGGQDGVEKDQILDFFGPPKDGQAGEAIARGKVVEVKSTEATVQVMEYFKAVWIEEGFPVRRPLE